MQVEWEPDPQSVYLTSCNQDGPGLDNIALHESKTLGDENAHPSGFLNHIGFFVPSLEDVDLWYSHIQKSGAKILREIKTHRDGARSFYFEDPDGIIIQLLYHIPIAKRVPLPVSHSS